MALSQEAREARRAYQREWRKKNQERVREYNRKYWERRAAKEKEAEETKEGCAS